MTKKIKLFTANAIISMVMATITQVIKTMWQILCTIHHTNKCITNNCWFFFFSIDFFSRSVEVTIRGAVDRKTGMVMNITELKDHMDHAIMKPLDHKNLDVDIEFFKVRVIWLTLLFFSLLLFEKQNFICVLLHGVEKWLIVQFAF